MSETRSETFETEESAPEAEPVEVEVEEEQDEISQPHTPEPQTFDPQVDQLSSAVEDESAPDEEAVSSSGDVASQGPTREDESAETNSPEVAETTPQPSATTKPFDPVYQHITPAAVPRPGKKGPATSATTDVVEADARSSTAQESRKAAARTGRLWGIVGMVVFGLLTLVGAILTVMATMLFFTENNLLHGDEDRRCRSHRCHHLAQCVDGHVELPCLPQKIAAPGTVLWVFRHAAIVTKPHDCWEDPEISATFCQKSADFREIPRKPHTKAPQSAPMVVAFPKGARRPSGLNNPQSRRTYGYEPQ